MSITEAREIFEELDVRAQVKDSRKKVQQLEATQKNHSHHLTYLQGHVQTIPALFSRLEGLENVFSKQIADLNGKMNYMQSMYLQQATAYEGEKVSAARDLQNMEEQCKRIHTQMETNKVEYDEDLKIKEERIHQLNAELTQTKERLRDLDDSSAAVDYENDKLKNQLKSEICVSKALAEHVEQWKNKVADLHRELQQSKRATEEWHRQVETVKAEAESRKQKTESRELEWEKYAERLKDEIQARNATECKHESQSERESEGLFTQLVQWGTGKAKHKPKATETESLSHQQKDEHIAWYKRQREDDFHQFQKFKAESEKNLSLLSEALKDLEAAETRNAELVERVMELKQMGDGEVCVGWTHSGLQSEYEALFTTKKRGVQKAMQSLHNDETRLTELMGKSFFAIYSECKAVVLHGLFDKLYQPHKHGEDTEAAKLQARVYGELLRSNPTPTFDTRDILNQVEGYLPGMKKLRTKANRSHITAYEDFLKESVELARKMVTISPPMITDQPQEFDENLHDEVYGQWNADLAASDDKYALVYYQSVLYNSYRDTTPVSKGRVGNKPIRYN